MQPGFDKLSVEVIVEIMSYLSYVDLINFRGVSLESCP